VSRVVVVGAGLGGLAVSARLARFRHEVVVVEATSTVGGALGWVERGGFAWDAGATVVTLPASVRDLFHKTGKVQLEEIVDLEPVEPTDYRFADGTAMPSADDDFFDRAGRAWTLLRAPLVESAHPGARSLLRLALRHPRLWPLIAPGRTLRSAARSSFGDRRRRQWLESYALTAGADPRVAPSIMTLLPYVEQAFRQWRVHGGMRQLVEAVHARAVDRGAEFVTDARVEAITTTAGHVDGVRLSDGRHLPADVVVSAVNARHLYDDLLPADVARSRPAPDASSASAFELLLGLRGTTRDLRPRIVSFPVDGDAELDQLFGRDPRPVDDPTMHIDISRDPAHAPHGDEAWRVLVAAPRHGAGGVEWRAQLAESYAKDLLDVLAGRGFDIRERITVAAHVTPADIAGATGVAGGASYGAFTNALRQRPNRGPVDGLFLVGATAHPGAGVPFVVMSAAIVADMIGRP